MFRAEGFRDLRFEGNGPLAWPAQVATVRRRSGSSGARRSGPRA